jgi:hypothetical protein
VTWSSRNTSGKPTHRHGPRPAPGGHRERRRVRHQQQRRLAAQRPGRRPHRVLDQLGALAARSQQQPGQPGQERGETVERGGCALLFHEHRLPTGGRLGGGRTGNGPRPRPRQPARPPGTGPGAAREALTNHLTDAAPWGARVSVETEGTGSPFRAATDGAAYTALGTAMEQVYGKPLAFLGQGGRPVLGSRWWQWSSSRQASCWRAGSGARS